MSNTEEKVPVKCSKVIKTCKYSGSISGAEICNYICIEGHRRGCPPEECTKYEKKSRKTRAPLKIAKSESTHKYY